MKSTTSVAPPLAPKPLKKTLEKHWDKKVTCLPSRVPHLRTYVLRISTFFLKRPFGGQKGPFKVDLMPILESNEL
jgi:hypothetical protein